MKPTIPDLVGHMTRMVIDPSVQPSRVVVDFLLTPLDFRRMLNGEVLTKPFDDALYMTTRLLPDDEDVEISSVIMPEEVLGGVPSVLEQVLTETTYIEQVRRAGHLTSRRARFATAKSAGW
ncbi:MAG: hypothetical protein IH861_07945 [Chloroflexi bacterium]|nr:hypothetical protein [Chloroflexota bacterium]